jgi:HEAT repeat protein
MVVAMHFAETHEAPAWEASVRLLYALPTLGPAERVETVAALVRSTSPAIRKRALRLGSDVLPDDMLVAWLRNDADDVLRNAGLEILKLRGSRAFLLARQLAADPDPDIVLQAALLLDHFRDPRGVTVLRGLLDYGDPNVVQAAILGLGHHRDAAITRQLVPFLDSDPWLQIAAIQALGDLGEPSALFWLEPLLADEFLESFAAESIAHIGGSDAFRILSARWLAHHSTLDAERYVSLLASVIVKLSGVRLGSALEDAVVAQLEAASATLRIAAASVLLASDSTHADRAALNVLVESEGVPTTIPPCLLQRRDLISTLLGSVGPAFEWGLQLASAFPGSARPREIEAAIQRNGVPEHLAAACSAIAMTECSEDAANSVIAIFARLPIERRRDFATAIARHGSHILDLLEKGDELTLNDATVLATLAGASASEVLPRIAGLIDDARTEVVSQILGRADVVRELPWEEWVEEAPFAAGSLLAEAVMAANFAEAAPLLRLAARRSPSPRVVEALACIGDEPSVHLLEEMLTVADGRIRACVCNALGSLGGERARAIFRRMAPLLPPGDAKFAYRAWAACADVDDLPAFRAVASHHEWLVRASAAEVLARYPEPASFDALASLALDPVESVASRALAIALK